MARWNWMLLLIAIAGFNGTAVADEATVTFTVEKMTCATCPFTVRKAMKNVDGVIDAKVDYDSKTATVTFDDAQTTPAEIANASTKIGYPATQSGGRGN